MGVVSLQYNEGDVGSVVTRNMHSTHSACPNSSQAKRENALVAPIQP